MRFYKHDIIDWMDGTESLSLGQYRVYHVIVQLIYQNEGPITRNDVGIAGRCNLRVDHFRKYLDALIRLEKLVEEGGKLMNERAAGELQNVGSTSAKRADAGRKSGAARRAYPWSTHGLPGGYPVATRALPTSYHESTPGQHIENIEGSANNCSTLVRTDQTRQDKTKNLTDLVVEQEQADRPVLGNYDFASDDGTVVITSEEFESLAQQFPSVKNIRGLARHACRSWLEGVRTADRKQVFLNWLAKKNSGTPRPARPPTRTAEEREQGLSAAIDADRARREQSDRALEVRRKANERARERVAGKTKGEADDEEYGGRKLPGVVQNERDEAGAFPVSTLQ